MKKQKVICLGEPLLRLSPEGNTRFLQANQFDIHFGGAEANVAVCMANLGMDCHYVGKVPDHAIGQAFIKAMQAEGVHTEDIARGGERLGIYYLENGASVRPSQVVYDRSHSSMSQARIEDFDWEHIFEGAVLLHVTGITPVISEAAANVTEYAILEAKRRNILVSFDLNYRAKLWQTDIIKKQERMRRLAMYADFCFGNPLDASRTLGYQDIEYDFEKEPFEICIQQSCVERMAKEYDLKGIFFTLRESLSASDNRLSALAYFDGKFFETGKMDIHIVDRVGGGDAFAAGILFGILTEKDPQKLLEFGLATGAIAHTMEGDFAITTEAEIEAIIKSGGTGRVQR